MVIDTLQTAAVTAKTPSTFDVRQLFGSLVADQAAAPSYSALSPQTVGDWEAAVRHREAPTVDSGQKSRRACPLLA